MDKGQTNTPKQGQGKVKYLLKLFVYFLFGLSGFIGSIIAGLWITFKTKVNKKGKLIALVTGLAVSIIVPYGTQLYVEAKYPEAKVVKNVLSEQFPNGSISLGISLSKRLGTESGPTTTRVLVVGFRSREFISGDEMIRMGRSVCSIISPTGGVFDGITIKNYRSPLYSFSLPLVSFSFSASGSCEKWDDQRFAQQINMMSGFLR